MTNCTTGVSDSTKQNVEYIPSKFDVHTFTEEILERKLVFQVIRMQDSLFLYINDKDHLQFNDLSFALSGRYDNSPLGTRVIGDFTEEFSKNITTRLSKATSKAVFLSFNVEHDRMFSHLVEKRIFEEIKKQPVKF